MDPILDEFHTAAREITFHEPRIPFISDATGKPAGPEVTTPEYWTDHIRGTVRYHDALQTAAQLGTTTYLELGATPTLTAPTRETLDTAHITPLLRPHTDETHHLLTALATTWTTGTPLTHSTTHTNHTPLPTYPFQHQHLWLESELPKGTPSALGLAPTDHLFLKTATTHPDGTTTYTGTLNLTTHPWLTDHTIHDTVLLPATALLDLTLHAAHDLHHPHIEELTLHTPTPLTTTPTQLHLTATPPHDHTRTLTIHTRPHTTNPHTPWTHTATATLTTTGPDTDLPTDNTWPPTHTTPIPLTHLYDDLTTHGYTYGPTFQGLTHAWKNHTTLHATTTLPTTQTPTHTTIHPALLDAALHPLLTTTDHTTLHLPTTFTHTTLHLPTTFTHTTLHTTHATTLHTTLTPHPTNPNTHTLTATDPHGTPVITTTLTTTPTTPTHLTHTLNTL
ncbi:polyketide synthase dehydratase domain-containing protein, partial [Kitasatospora sp. NPDC048538]|uniref:polyketide synthase dehydratase domain-containing protein n=1 Tax=Kitasatospora sp. NPDC048538 TaxID=3155633 RepID=UPI0033F24107